MIDFKDNRQTTLFNNKSFLKEKLVFSIETYKLSLRKRKIEEHLLLKRNILQAKDNELNTTINLLSIPNEAKDFLLNHKGNNTLSQLIEKCSMIALQISKYLSNTSILAFLLDHLNRILTLIPVESLSLISTTKLIESLHALIVKYQANHSLMYLVIASLIKCSMSTDKDFNDKFITVPFLQNYISLLKYINKLQFTPLTSHLLLFLSNIVSENDYIQEVFYSYGIFDLVAEKLSDDCNENDIKASISFFACFASLKQFPCLDCALKLQSLFSYFLDKVHCALLNGVNIRHNEEVLYTCIWGLYFVYFHQAVDLISEDNLDISLIEEVIDSCDYLNKGYHLALGILGNITARNDDTICYRAYSEKTSQFIIKCLRNSQIHIKIQSMWVASNLSIGSNLACLAQYDFYANIISIMKKESDLNVQSEFLQFLISCVINCEGNFEIEYQKLFNADLLSILFNMMTKDHCDYQMLIILLESLCEYNIEKTINDLKNIGVKDFLEKCNQIPNEEIQVHSNQLMERYFQELST